VPDSTAGDLGVVTFNIRTGWALDGRHCWWLRRSATAAVLRRLRPDVAALQEVHRFQLRYLLGHLAGYGAAGVGRTNGRRRGEHCAVLYRTDRLVLEGEQTRWFSDRPNEPGSRTWGNVQPRIATLAWFSDRAGGPDVGLVNVHLDERSGAARARSAAAMEAWVEEHRGDGRHWLLAGDFNTPPDDDALRVLVDAGWRDLLAPLPAGGDDAGTVHSFTGSRDRGRIDLILGRDDWTVVTAGVVHDRPRGRLPSDHWPVAARLRPVTSAP
jgi:endonuclease/exonuclease/phosphatase family metal-dependent hydrolase